MATGLRLPIGVGPTGGASLVDHEENDNKIIFTALSAGDSENAFQQDIALGDRMVFDTNDSSVRAKIIGRLVSIFNRFVVQKRYRLKKDTVKFTTDSTTQELILEFRYVNLETDEEQNFKRTFTRNS